LFPLPLAFQSDRIVRCELQRVILALISRQKLAREQLVPAIRGRVSDTEVQPTRSPAVTYSIRNRHTTGKSGRETARVSESCRARFRHRKCHGHNGCTWEWSALYRHLPLGCIAGSGKCRVHRLLHPRELSYDLRYASQLAHAWH